MTPADLIYVMWAAVAVLGLFAWYGVGCFVCGACNVVVKTLAGPAAARENLQDFPLLIWLWPAVLVIVIVGTAVAVVTGLCTDGRA